VSIEVLTMQPLPANKALDQFFLDARCRLLDLAATLDRIDRGEDSNVVWNDPRLARIRRALEVMLGDEPNKAEQIQKLFSLEYDSAWKMPQPRF
jgi:hypothetical protein